METNKICKYCKLELQACISEGLDCIICTESIHLKCLDKRTVPGELNGDVFYTLTCKECSPTKEEIFLRDKLSWLQVIVLTLYNLQIKNMHLSKKGYFHAENDIASFIRNHWDIFFDKHTDKKIKLLDIVESTLSQFNNNLFRSGEQILGEPMWWTLKYPKLTPSTILSLNSICCKVKKKTKEERNPLVKRTMYMSLLRENLQNKGLLMDFDESCLADKDSSDNVERSTVSEHEQTSTETISSSPNLLRTCTIEDNSFACPSSSHKPLSDSASASEPVSISERKRRNSGMMTLSPSELLTFCSNGNDLLCDPSTSYTSLITPESEQKTIGMMSSCPSKLFESCSDDDDLLADTLTSYDQLSDTAAAFKSSTIPEHELRSNETMSLSPNLLEFCSVEDDIFSDSSTSYKPPSDPASVSKSATIPKRKRQNIAMMSSSPSKLFKSCSNEDDLLGDHSTTYNPLSDSASASKSATISKRKLRTGKTTSSSRKSWDSCSKKDDSVSGPSTRYKPLSHSVSASKSATISKRKLRTAKPTAKISKRKLKSSKTTSSSRRLLDSCSKDDSSTSYNTASASKSAKNSKRKLRSSFTTSSSRRLLDSCTNEDDSFSDSSSYNPASASKSAKICEHKEKCTRTRSSASAGLLETFSNEEEDILGCHCSRYEPGLSPVSEYFSSDNSFSSSPHGSPPSSKPTSSQSTYRLNHFNTCMTSVSKARNKQLTEELIGDDRIGLIESPSSGIFLNPYIWQDIETFPAWLQLMCQIELKSNQHIKDYVVPPRASIDYVYVQPEHIKAVNTLCNQYICSDIDLTESLQHPEFSCVVLYKRLVVAFAFIIPNVSDSEHYLSYIFTRPGWRRVGIAKRMLYFLLKNSAGKDVTLHVPLDNVACFMYHKFGFKVERRDKNFYAKYIRIKKDESTDALFCRRKQSYSGDM